MIIYERDESLFPHLNANFDLSLTHNMMIVVVMCTQLWGFSSYFSSFNWQMSLLPAWPLSIVKIILCDVHFCRFDC